MDWIHNYDLFLFDCDGLLVDTEPLHFQAYCTMAFERGVSLTWSLPEFLSFAHLGSHELQEAFEEHFPTLLKQTGWKTLYEEKKTAYLKLLAGQKVELMPGVEALIEALSKAGKESCVVTNSFKEQMDLIRVKQPVLNQIHHWITREDYQEQKPHPECYLRAIELYGKGCGRMIGFEDSVRGIKALKQTPALPVLICPKHHPLLEIAKEREVCHYEYLDLIPSKGPSYTPSG